MKAKKVAYTAHYWSCGVSAHRHKSKENAEKCIATVGQRRKRVIKWTHERNMNLLRLLLGGETARKAGIEFGVSSTASNAQAKTAWRRAKMRCRRAGEIEKYGDLECVYGLLEMRENKDAILSICEKYGTSDE